MLEFKQIKELVELVAEHQLEGVELERSGFRLRIEGHRTQTVAVAAPEPLVVASPPPAASAAVAAPPEAAAEEAPDPLAGAHVIPSPIVGTFYRSPSPDQPPFVEVGDRVSKGQILCIVEAMKLMNEIESDVSGVVAEVFAANEQAVEYDEPLFAIKPD